jgi:HEAT repeat protein
VGLALTLTGTCLFAATSPVENACDNLTAGVSDKNVEKRSDATQALGLLIDDKRARVMAEKALDDDSPEVRVAAADALGEMQSRASIPKLHDALSDKDPTVVLAAAHALLLLKDDREYEVYYAILTGERKTGNGLLGGGRKMLHDPKKLAEFGVETGLGTFVPFGGFGLTAWKRLTKDDSSIARAAAARVLAKDPDPQSGSALLEAISDRSWIVRVAALESLAKRGNPVVLKQIEPAMQDQKEAVQYTAAAAVIRLSQHRRARQPEKKSSQILPLRSGLPNS